MLERGWILGVLLGGASCVGSDQACHKRVATGDGGSLTTVFVKFPASRLSKRLNVLYVLVISEDLDEVLALADQVAVMDEGEILAVVDRSEADRESLGLLMAGVKSGVGTTG